MTSTTADLLPAEPSAGLLANNLRTVRPRWPRALLLAAGLIALVEGAIRLMPAHLGDSTVSYQARIAFVEEHLVPLAPRPEVVILGSSRSAFGIAPGAVERAAGAPEGAVLNLSIPGAASYVSELMRARHADRIARARVVLYNVDEFYFFGIEDEYLYEDPILHHLAWRQPEDRPGIVLDRTFAFRMRLPWLTRRALAASGLVPGLPYLGYTIEGDRFLSAGMTSGDATEADMARVVEDYYSDQRYAPRTAAFMEQSARETLALGAYFAFVQMPYHPTHSRMVNERYPEARPLHISRMRDLAARVGVPFVDWTDPASCGLGAADFADGVHLSVTGTPKFSAFLGRWLAGQRATPVAVPTIGRRRVE